MSRLDEIEQRATRAERAYSGQHVVAWRYGVCVGDSEDVPWLLARIRALEAGLAWYADEKNYDEETGAAGKFRRLPNTVHDPGEVVFDPDGGDVARAALAGAG